MLSTSKCFPLRWETTLEQWWCASPIELAAAHGHYDVVRELLLADNNHLIKLTSLRRIHRLETLWDETENEEFGDISRYWSSLTIQICGLGFRTASIRGIQSADLLTVEFD